ncbi:S-layer protein [Paenibacillus sp. 32O-W]|uniref:S-layer homology domain-containing protein n=1 Tax=Paenibacillus sp. 32O-W TaxID=1695218 RepID=UPI00072123D0|nr:S-layer homology domain-containing protein [Paenibacillus sp. 32O-W]ALS25966.1 S-layer protein [Paenibacillus sp. 32O-W]
MRSSRKWLAVTVSAALLASAVPAGAYAEKAASSAQGSSRAEEPSSPEASASQAVAAMSKAQAEALARKLVHIPDDYKLQSANYGKQMFDPNGEGFNVWNLYFVKKKDGKQIASIQAGINADESTLVSFSSDNYDPGAAPPSYPPEVDRTEAQQLAMSFIQSIAPALVGQIELDPYYGQQLKPPLNGDVVYLFRYNRIVNDLPYVENFIDIEVDGEGHVRSYRLQWEKSVRFEKAGTVLNSEQAIAKLRAAASPELVYKLIRNTAGRTSPQLAYVLKPVTIDAATGEVIKPQYEDDSALEASPVSAKPLGTAPKAGAQLSKEQAVQTVKDAFGLPKGAELTGSDYNEYEDEYEGVSRAQWNLSWTVKENGKDSGSVWASVDSRTGQIRNYSAYTNSRQQSGKGVTYGEAKAKAVATVKKQLPWLADQLYLRASDAKRYEGKTPEEVGQYYLAFIRKVNGARVEYDYVHVGIDAITGQIREFSADVRDLAYPAKPQLIGDAKAIDAWMDYYRVELTYQKQHKYEWNGEPIPVEKYRVLVAAGEIRPGEGIPDGETKLVYRLVPKTVDEPVFLDAESGQWRNLETGEVTQLELPQATDVEGHPAQRELELMVAYKALDLEDGKVRPEAVITRGELIKMLVLSMNSGRPPRLYEAASQAKASFNDVAADSELFAYVETAVQQNLIDIGDGSFNPEGKVDREEMAELIVRALGYNTLANHEELFRIEFSDAAEVERKGQAAIAIGLGIMDTVDGKFLPDREVTRGEAAASFFRFLRVSSELREAPLRNG